MAALKRELVDALFSAGAKLDNVFVVGEDVGGFDALLPSSRVVVGSVSQLSAAPAASFDAVIANNAIGTKRTPEHITSLLRAALFALDEGFLLVREDLDGDLATVADYTNLFDTFRTASPKADVDFGFGFYYAKSLEASIHSNKCWKDYCWFLENHTFPKTDAGGVATFRDFLDKTQYKDEGILSYEWIFGEGFISPGGGEENLHFLNMLQPRPGQHMLDIGCGIGGSAFQLASEFGCYTTGVDLSSNMLAVALDRANKAKDTRVRFMVADVMTWDFPAGHYDLVYSRDCVQHIEDKGKLLARCFSWLKPGGKLLITGYTAGGGEQSDEFKTYVAARKYFLASREVYEEAAKAAGFVDVSTADISDRFVSHLEAELKMLTAKRDEFLKKFSQSAFDSLMKGWKSKLVHVSARNHSWFQCVAQKPVN